MKISVQSAARCRHPVIVETLEASSRYPYKYVGVDKLNPISLTFEVETVEEERIVIMATEKELKTVLGRGVQFRVVPFGKVVYYR